MVEMRAAHRRADADLFDVSVVLPVYNERGHLRQEIDRIRAALTASPYTFEIIVVDDGSDDGSEVDLPAIDGIRLIRHTPEPRLRRSPPHRHDRRPRARRRVDRRRHDVPERRDPDARQGARRASTTSSAPGAPRRARSASLRVPAKWFIRKLAAYLAETDIKDLNSGLRAFRRDVAMQYVHHLPKGFSCVTTLTMSFLSNGYSVKYVPIDYFPRAGTSKFHWWQRHQALPAAGRAHDAVVQPAQGVPADRRRCCSSPGSSSSASTGAERDFRLAANTLLIFLAALQSITVGLLADLIVRATKPATQVPPA